MQKTNISWEQAIRQVLQKADGALHYSEIAEQIVSQGLRKSVGATPSMTVSSYLSTSLRGEDSPYLRVGRGQYALKDAVQEKTEGIEQTDSLNDEPMEAGALKSFGMFWRRELVAWNAARPSLFGRQQAGASKVNFSDQIGIYLLHDRDRVIYVGRASDSLSTRLRAHTSDRLGGRWDRFSWFGLHGVDENAKLIDSQAPWTQNVVIDTMEALLIESLEPPLNRKRGDNFSGVEYMQVVDPKIEKLKNKAFLEEIAKKMEI